MARTSDGEAARLPRPAEYPILRGPLGGLVLRPWYDRLAVRAVGRWVLPLSRAWAAGLASGGSLERFLRRLDRAEGGRGERARAARLLAVLEARRRNYERAAADWEEALFAPAAPPAAELVACERARQAAAHRLMAARLSALPLHLRRAVPAVRWEVAPPQAVAAAHGHRLGDARAAFPAPDPVAPARSHELPGAYGTEHWLRFASPVLGDAAWARVYAPAGAAHPPSLVYLHGIFLEAEFWRDVADPVSGLAGRGVRVIQPEGPWHGRRRPEGWYGGEPALGRGPLGLVQLFQAWVAEVAALVLWARRTSRGPVAVGGVSLGALAAQLAVAACRHWPAEAAPDAAFLVATSDSLLDVAQRGSLSRLIGLWPRAAAAGWGEADVARWRPLLEPLGQPGVPPDRIVMLLGRYDDLVPFTGGRALARRWGVPAENLFVRPRGHFSVSLALARDRAPLERLLGLLGSS